MGSYGKKGTLWRPSHFMAGVQTVDKPFQNHPESPVGQGRKLTCIPTPAGTLMQSMSRMSPTLPRHKTGPAEGISV